MGHGRVQPSVHLQLCRASELSRPGLCLEGDRDRMHELPTAGKTGETFHCGFHLLPLDSKQDSLGSSYNGHPWPAGSPVLVGLGEVGSE